MNLDFYDFSILEKEIEKLPYERRKEDANPNWGRRPLEEQRREIASHPFAVREMAKQTEDLQRLKNAEILDKELLLWLRTSSSNNGKSLIHLSRSQLTQTVKKV
jgi:hypothetical protein